MVKYSILSHILHMIGMVVFGLIFGLYIKPEVDSKFGKDDPALGGILIFGLTTSIILALDIFVMEIMVALSMLPVLPISFGIYCFAGCCGPRIKDAMNRIPGQQQSEEDIDFLFHFRKGMSWQQLLLYIYKNNKIIFKKANFREYFAEKDSEFLLTPTAGTPDVKNPRERGGSFLTGDGTRKNSEIHLMGPDDLSNCGSPDNSFTPIRPYDSKLQAFMRDIEDEFKFSEEDINYTLNLKKCKEEAPKAESPPKRLDDDSVSEVSNSWNLSKVPRKSAKNEARRKSVIKGRPSIKKIDRGILCAICQDDLEENDTVLQLDCGRTHLLHFGCLKEWLSFKFECPTGRTNLLTLYKDKVKDEALKNKEIGDEDQHLYPEDLIPLQNARDRLLGEIEEMESNQNIGEGTSLKK